MIDDRDMSNPSDDPYEHQGQAQIAEVSDDDRNPSTSVSFLFFCNPLSKAKLTLFYSRSLTVSTKRFQLCWRMHIQSRNKADSNIVCKINQ